MLPTRPWKEFIMDYINLNIPFMALSTMVNREGEIEERFLTPFGTIDVIFRNALDTEEGKKHIEIAVEGYPYFWTSYDSTFIELRLALLHFVRRMLFKYPFEKEVRTGFGTMDISVRGSEIDTTGS